jgi:hypothetical protein
VTTWFDTTAPEADVTVAVTVTGAADVTVELDKATVTVPVLVDVLPDVPELVVLP